MQTRRGAARAAAACEDDNGVVRMPNPVPLAAAGLLLPLAVALVALIGRRWYLFGISIDDRLPESTRLAVTEMLELGVPTAVFILPPETAG